MSDDFASLSLPDHLRRDSVLKPEYRPNGYFDALDRDTLWYDAVWSDGRLRLFCPPLNNFRPEFRKATFRADNTVLRLRRLRRYARHEIAEFEVAECPQTISVQMFGWCGETRVHRAATELFAGLNTAVLLTRNNALDWIATHAAYHRAAHGLQALIVLDNASSEYGCGEIEMALRHVGLERLLVLDTPFKFGPAGHKPYRWTEKYLQTAMYNILRDRFLSRARAVLNCDVDELIVSRSGSSVFDAAQKSRLGMVQIAGHWVYPAPDNPGPFCHADHSHTKSPPKPCPPKWCLVPSGPLGGYSWDVHGVERLPFLRRRTQRDFRFLHCRSLTTGWKPGKRHQIPDDTVPDDFAALAAAYLAKTA